MKCRRMRSIAMKNIRMKNTEESRRMKSIQMKNIRMKNTQMEVYK